MKYTSCGFSNTEMPEGRILIHSSGDRYSNDTRSLLRKKFLYILIISSLSAVIVMDLLKTLSIKGSWRLSSSFTLNKKMAIFACTAATLLGLLSFNDRIHSILLCAWARAASREARADIRSKRFQYAHELQNNPKQTISRIRLLSHYRFYVKVPLRLLNELVQLVTLPLYMSLTAFFAFLGLFHPDWGRRCVGKIASFWSIDNQAREDNPFKASFHFSPTIHPAPCMLPQSLARKQGDAFSKNSEGTFLYTLYPLIYDLLPSCKQSLSIPHKEADTKTIISSYQKNLKTLERTLDKLSDQRLMQKKKSQKKACPQAESKIYEKISNEIGKLIEKLPTSSLKTSCMNYRKLFSKKILKKKVISKKLPTSDEQAQEPVSSELKAIDLWSHNADPRFILQSSSSIRLKTLTPAFAKHILQCLQNVHEKKEEKTDITHLDKASLKPQTLQALLSLSADCIQNILTLRGKEQAVIFNKQATEKNISQTIAEAYQELKEISTQIELASELLTKEYLFVSAP